MVSAIAMENVSFRYGDGRSVLNDVNMECEAGKFYAITGNSGAGKSTLLALLAGLDRPKSGTITVQGVPVNDLSKHRKNNVALVFQAYNLIDYLTPLENLRLVDSSASVEDLERLGITPEQARRNVLQLSGGQQQRVAIGRALASKAPVILADEPTGNLDSDTAQSIVELLKRAAHEYGKTVIAVTHSRDLARQADEHIVMKKGKLMPA